MMKGIKIRLIIVVMVICSVVLSCSSKFIVFASTIDDVRELIGGYRLTEQYTDDEIESILLEYFRIKKHNNVVDILKLVDKIVMEDDEKTELDISINEKKVEFYKRFKSGEYVDSVLEARVEIDVLTGEKNGLRGSSNNLEMNYIDDAWMKNNNEISLLVRQIKDNFDIGDLGTSLKSPVLSSFVITSPYGMRRDPFGSGVVMHYGLDLRARNGEPILSQWNGVVSGVYETEIGGKTVAINHGVGLKTRYLHLSEIYVREGQSVNQYQIIGSSGDTGRVTGEHLHFEVYVDGNITNPIYFYGQKGINALKVFLSDNVDYDDWNKNVLLAIKDVENKNYFGVVGSLGNECIVGYKRFDIDRSGNKVFYSDNTETYEFSKALDLLNELVK